MPAKYHTPAEVVSRSFRSGSVKLSELPDLLRAIAGDVDEWADKLGCRAKMHMDQMNPKNLLIDWPKHSPLTLEVQGDEGEYSLCSIRVEGRRMDEFIKDDLWDDAEEYIQTLNDGDQASHKDFERNFSHSGELVGA